MAPAVEDCREDTALGGIPVVVAAAS